MTVQHKPGVDTLEAVVGGGVGQCGKGSPRWFMRIGAYRDWIICIMDGINEGKTKGANERYCTFKWKIETIDKFPEENLIF